MVAMHPGKSARRRGFTLVELLVVIGIISILVSLLMPSLAKARRQAQRTQCVAQMRQVGIAFNAYIAENKGFTPYQPTDLDHFAEPATLDAANVNSRSMLGTLLTYINMERRIYLCPTAQDETWTGGNNPTQYSNTNFMVNDAIIGRSISRLKGMAEIIIMQEDRFRWSIAWMRPRRVGAVNGQTIYSGWAFPNAPPWGQEYSVTHDRGGNLLFGDGHAEWRHNEMLRARDFGLRGGAGVSGTEDDINSLPVHFGINYYFVGD